MGFWHARASIAPVGRYNREPTTSCLKVVPGLHLGDASPREIEVAISLDALGPGAAPALAYKEMREVRQFAGDLQALNASFGDDSPLHKELKWSFALPVPKGQAFADAAGVLIIDGLDDPSNGVLDNELMEDDDIFNILIKIGEYLSPAWTYYA